MMQGVVYSESPMAIQSMTGFGSAERPGCRVEVRSINHRFMDIYLKTPSFLNQLEMPFRSLLKERFSRGKFDVSVTVSLTAATDFVINADAVRRLSSTFRQLQQELALPGELDISTLVGLHELFIGTEQGYDAEAIMTLFRQAVEDLRAMRMREGASLAAEIGSMTDDLAEMNNRIRTFSATIAADVLDKFNERLKTLLEGREIDQGRILQEAAVIAARLDISEEITRIDSHLKQFRALMAGGGIIGRKLDFILQELNREVNTIGSKSSVYEVSSLAVDMKTEIEKIREQVQNIE